MVLSVCTATETLASSIRWSSPASRSPCCGLDQFTKHLVSSTFLPGESRFVIPHFLKWTYERNVHGAFGLFGSNAVLLIGMAIVVLVLFWFSFREAAARSLTVRMAFGMIVGGAIGNVVDRLHYGYVIDFIDFYRIWPNIFNVAIRASPWAWDCS